jgi:hypothetical protein
VLRIEQGLRVGRQERNQAPARSGNETPAETPEKPAKEQEFTFWAFPSWHRTSASSTPSGERSRERV